MKLAILSDIHANVDGLYAVLEAASKAGAEKLVLCGDYVGYYYFPAETWSVLSEWSFIAIRGNHEVMLERAIKDVAFRIEIQQRYGSGIEYALNALSDAVLEQLINLPDQCEFYQDGYRYLVCHGSPWDPDAYLYPDTPIPKGHSALINQYSVIFMGHTHYPMFRKYDYCQLVNPGSVGQPRNKRPGAAWALHDTITGTTELRNEIYDYGFLQQMARQIDPHCAYLSEILNRS